MDSCEWATQLGCKVIQYRDGNNKKRVMVVDLLDSDLRSCFT